MTTAKLLLDSAYDGIKVKSFSVASELLSEANGLGVRVVFVHSEWNIVGSTFLSVHLFSEA